jgi:PAS domain S-box-containing protein
MHGVAYALGEVVLELSPSGACLGLVACPAADPSFEQDLVGKSLRDVLAARSVGPVMRALARLQHSAAAQTLEACLQRASGSREYELRVVRGFRGNLLASLRDVHGRRACEDGLRESEALFRVMADHAPVMLWKSGTNAECDFFNQGWLEFTGRPLEAELGVGWASGVHPEDFQQCMDVYLAAFVARRPFRMEYRLRRADGEYRWILDHGTPRVDAAGVFAGFVGSCIDITDTKDAEVEVRGPNVALQSRIAEREVLLREVHHRVKNNLQLIISILSLQARLLSGEARSLIEEGQLRVRSMALVHEKLCESRSLAEVDLLDYTRELVRALLHAIGNGVTPEVRVDGDALLIGADQAVPCGLVIAELVTNALKHAFPGGRSGTVAVQVSRTTAQRIRLTVADDGIGLPVHVDLQRPATLGLDLVVTLARQLNAELEHRPGPGTRFDFDFPAARIAHAS